MRFIHTECGGAIDIETRTCLKCGRKWNWLSFRLTPTEIRPVLTPSREGTVSREKIREAVRKAPPSRRQYAKWGDRIPGVPIVASRLPNWPRWARLLVTATLIGVVVVIIVLVVR